MNRRVDDFIPNYDETEKEPEVLPVKVPNLLINGAEGIAVGMATSIPPHNFGEVVDGVIAYMKNPDITTAEMMQYKRDLISRQEALLQIRMILQQYMRPNRER